MTIRKSERAVVYLSNSLKHWQPGKISVMPGEWLIDELLGAYNKTRACDSLGVLDFQIDKMTRNSKS